MASIETLLTAIGHQRAGRRAEAEALYRSILAAEPDQGQVLYLYGLSQFEAGRTHDAAATLQRAAAVRPAHAATSLYLTRALLADRQPDAARRRVAAASCARPASSCDSP